MMEATDQQLGAQKELFGKYLLDFRAEKLPTGFLWSKLTNAKATSPFPFFPNKKLWSLKQFKEEK